MQQNRHADTGASATQPRGRFLRRAFERWTQAAHAIGAVQTRFLLLAIYGALVVPLGVVFRARQDPLRLRPPADGNWVECSGAAPTLERARRQY